jgi:hypothetical protein
MQPRAFLSTYKPRIKHHQHQPPSPHNQLLLRLLQLPQRLHPLPQLLRISSSLPNSNSRTAEVLQLILQQPELVESQILPL